MNIQQLEYLIAIDEYRHFAKAADYCEVTQPTLSTMVQRLEDELNVKIFNRSKHPIEPTDIGRQIIEQARVSLKQFEQIKKIVKMLKTQKIKIKRTPTRKVVMEKAAPRISGGRIYFLKIKMVSLLTQINYMKI